MLWKGNKMFTSIPFPIVEDRPLIAYHPGPHQNYLASWNVMVDNGQPFVLICDDLGPDYPDGGWGQQDARLGALGRGAREDPERRGP